MQAHDQGHRLETGNASDHLGAPLRVQPHEAALVLGEAAGLAEDVRGQAELPDIVEQRGELHLHDLRACQPKPLADHGRGGRNLERMMVGVPIRLGQRLHQAANLGLRVARGQLSALVVAQGFSRKHAQLTQQLHFWRFELSLLVPAADAQCTAFLKPGEEGSGGHRTESGGVHSPADQVGIRAGSRDHDEAARVARRAHRDPRLVEPQHGACVADQAVEHHARIAQPLGRRHPCRRWGGEPQHCAHCHAVKFFRKVRSSGNTAPHGSRGGCDTKGVR